MKPTKTLFLTVLMLAALSAGTWAQTPAATPVPTEKDKATAPAPAPAVTAADVQELKDALAAQQRQIQALQEELHRRDQVVQQAQSVASDASAKADAAQTQALGELKAVNQLQSEVADLKSVSNTSADNATLKNAVLSLQDPPQTSSQDSSQTFNKQMEGAVTIHFKGINITPGGYAEAAFVRRSRALGSDLPTPFNSLTMPGASQSQLSEFFGSARQSKITTFVDGRLGNVDLSSYVSADFLSAGVTSTSTQTNSYTLRLRQAWGQAKFANGWSFLGGQEWSLVTENGAGISPDDDLGRTNDARPKTIDPSYNVGFAFARQYGVRVTKSFSNKVAIAVAVEAPQATLSSHGNAANYLLGESGASNSYNTTATYSFNPSPDIIAKIAFDPGVGHYEVFGLFDRFRDRVFPCVENYASAACGTLTAASAVEAYNASKDGGGIGASARWKLPKNFTFGVKGFGGSGIGRYGPAGLPDTSVYADGTLHLVKNLMGLATLEWHGKKLDLYAYTGAEYASRTADFDPILGKTVGYGSPYFSNTGCYTETAPATSTSNPTGGFDPGSLANCTADTRAVIEGTAGFWYRFYSGPRGRFQFGTQYSYVTRQTWSGVAPVGAGSGSPEGLDGMVYTSFRYYLP